MNGFLQSAVRLRDSRVLFCCLLALPGVYYQQAYLRGTLFYGEVVHATGVLSARLLILTMAITPLACVLPGARWILWLRRRRRYLGVATFGYALFHLIVYAQRQGALDRILEDAMTGAMLTGWIGLLLMLALAATSNDASVRWMKRRWKTLHKAVYVVALMSFAHWVLSAFNPVPGYFHLGVLLLLESLRLRRLRKQPQ